MASTVNLRAQIEATLANRVPAPFSVKIKQSPEFFSTGIEEADTLLEGGIPRGNITEISGALSTGKTSFVLSAVAAITQSGAACAWIDVYDALSPESAAAAGIAFERLLWLRTKHDKAEQQANQRPQETILSPPANTKRQVAQQGGGSHPRNEMRGIDHAVSLLFKGEGGLLRDKTIGTPSRGNRPLSEPGCAGTLSRIQPVEQVAGDRLPARREEYFLNKSTESREKTARQIRSANSIERQQPLLEKPWSRLEQALKATDLLLQAGGFAAIVLDMSDVLPQHAMHIPLATWYRFRLAAEQARSSLILLTQSPSASSCAALTLRCEPSTGRAWSAKGETPLFESEHYTLTRERNRNGDSVCAQKRPSARAEWDVKTEWARVR